MEVSLLKQKPNITPELAKKVIATQFPEYADFAITEVAQQGHDNRTYRVGNHMLVRMPTTESYALKVPIEHAFLPKLAQHLTVLIPKPIQMGKPSSEYPYPFSLYKWIAGVRADHVTLGDRAFENMAYALANFLQELQNISDVKSLEPGQHNWWRGAPIRVYDKSFQKQIADLKEVVDTKKALNLWNRACATKWRTHPVWIHGDFAASNILIKDHQLSSVIDFGGTAMGDPACDLVIAWTYLSGKTRDIFIREMNLDDDTWLRARAWALWKATFELCQIKNKDSFEAKAQKRIIDEVIKFP